MNEILAWTILILGFVLAAVGTIVPGLPGALFVVIGLLVHKMMLPEVFSWWTLAVIVALAVFSSVVDLFAGVWGAQLGGATKQGILGAAIGGFVGLLFGLPGLLLGPFLGAIVGDIYGKRRDLLALMKSGSGAAFGYFISVLARLGILVVMMITVTLGAMF